MTWTISPDSYDVVVIGSGLPECLVAASLVKSGKSVLIIDAVDTYGTDFASFTPAALQDFLVLHQPQAAAANTDDTAAAPDAAASGSSASALSSPPLPAQSQAEGEHEHSMPTCSSLLEPLPAGCRLLRLQQRPLPLSGLRALAVPGEGGGPADRRGYILDLAPKVVYQAEALVDLLVRCRCHHYLEFKALEGSYLLQDGALQSVPAGRADIFRDRRLGLGDKRVLMRFIQGCVEARSGQGHLKEALSASSTTPLAQVLQAEGLSPRLREVILYGIAMCDTDQEPPTQPPLPPPSPPPPPPSAASQPTQQDPPSSGSDDAGCAIADCAAAAPSAVAGSTNTGGSSSSPPGTVISGAEGGAALELFTSSQGRFGQEAAFMLPSYGSGSVAEAFVRLCAVHGAVTVLRQPVQALAVSDVAAAGTAAGTAAAEAEAAEAKPTAEAEAEAVDVQPVGAAMTGASTPPEGPSLGAAGVQQEGGRRETSAVPAGAAASVGPEGGSGGCHGCEGPGSRCVAVVTAAGQVVRCGTVVAGISTLSCLEGVASPGTQLESVSRAVVVLDGPLLPAAAAQQQSGAPSLMTAVVPPRCQGVQGCSGSGGGGSSDGTHGGSSGSGIGNPNPVRALQQGATTCVCPAGRFLLYLSTPATSASSYDDLWPTLDVLVDTSGLRDPTKGAAAAPTGTPAAASSASTMAAAPASADAPTACSRPTTTVAAAGTATEAACTVPPAPSPSSADQAPAATTATAISAAAASTSPAQSRPRALRAWFFRQPVLHRPAAAAALAGQLPGGVVAVPGPDGALAGYDKVLGATEAVFRSAFPEATWLAEADFGAQGGGGGEGEEPDGAGSGAAHVADEDDDAIDELTAAVAKLKGT